MDTTKKIIVLIEDEQQLCMILKKKLEESGFEVYEYSTGTEGITGIGEKHPNLIILDIMLPGGTNGFDVLEAIQKNPITKPIPVIILTNLDSEASTAKTIGAVDYIIKTNTSLDDVVQKIRKYLP